MIIVEWFSDQAIVRQSQNWVRFIGAKVRTANRAFSYRGASPSKALSELWSTERDTIRYRQCQDPTDRQPWFVNLTSGLINPSECTESRLCSACFDDRFPENAGMVGIGRTETPR